MEKDHPSCFRFHGREEPVSLLLAHLRHFHSDTKTASSIFPKLKITDQLTDGEMARWCRCLRNGETRGPQTEAVKPAEESALSCTEIRPLQATLGTCTSPFRSLPYYITRVYFVLRRAHIRFFFFACAHKPPCKNYRPLCSN